MQNEKKLPDDRWEYQGPLENYHYNNLDIDDLFVFLKIFSGRDIWIIDNWMFPDTKDIPEKYKIIIVGIFGERLEPIWLTAFAEKYHDRKIIIFTSQEIILTNDLPDWCNKTIDYHPYLDHVKVFNLEHLHKCTKFVLNIDLQNKNSQLYHNQAIVDRPITFSLYNHRVDYQKLLVFALFLQHCSAESLFSFVDTTKFNFEDLENYLISNDLDTSFPVDKKLLNKIIDGPRYSAEDLVESNQVDKLLKHYFNEAEYLGNGTTKIDWNKTCAINPNMYQTMLNWVVETEIHTVYRAGFLTEKTLKPIITQTPFVLIANNKCYERLEKLGFNTYESIFRIRRYFFTSIGEKIKEVKKLFSKIDKKFILDNATSLQTIANQNYNWFFNGFYDHCENLNRPIIQEACGYINDN